MAYNSLTGIISNCERKTLHLYRVFCFGFPCHRKVARVSFYFHSLKVKLSESNFTFAPLRYWTGVSPIGRGSIRSERLNASDISPDSASCRGFFLPLNHEETSRHRPP